jgi:hypothetical protein
MSQHEDKGTNSIHDASPRVWYGLHITTWSVAILAALAIVARQLTPTVVLVFPVFIGFVGWPLPLLGGSESDTKLLVEGLLADLGISVALLASVVYVVERWLRQANRRQMSLSTMLTLVPTFGALVLLLQSGWLGISPITDTPMILLVGFLVFTVIHLAGRGVGRLMTRTGFGEKKTT